MASEAEITALQLEAKEHQGRLANTRGWKEGFFSGAFRESTALPAPGFGTRSLQSRETIIFYCFKSHRLQYFAVTQLQQL